jgi:hypothetical protein
MATRVMISGSIGSHPLYSAGNSWAFLQYVLGFRKLGIETYYIEELNPEDCVDEAWNSAEFTQSANAGYFRALMDRFDLTGHAALLESDGPGHVGLSRAEIEAIAPEIDLLINGSGHLHIASILGAVRRRMYLDLDPGYTQIWQEGYGIDMNLHNHDVYVTVGLNLGDPECPLPSCGIRWEKTLPPVVMDQWTPLQAPGNAYSTVADWRSFNPVEWRGVWYKQKADEFKRIIELPRRVRVPLELCLAIDPAEPDRPELERHGWRLTQPAVHASTVDAYRQYITASRGEFTAVKGGYAAGRTGWFSDRSACYLAAGRPVIMQSTGFEHYLPVGLGLVTFTDIETAVAAIGSVESNYARHARAASDFAREFFDSHVVLNRLLSVAGLR